MAGRPGLEAALRLTGYQLREAVRLVATGARDPRLATLLAQGGGRAATRALLSHQLQVWDKWGMSGYMDDDRRLLYRLLAGEVRVVSSCFTFSLCCVHTHKHSPSLCCVHTQQHSTMSLLGWQLHALCLYATS